MHLPSKADFRILVLRWSRKLFLCAMMMGIGAALCYGLMRSARSNSPAGTEPLQLNHLLAEAKDKKTVQMAEAKWANAGIRAEPASYAVFNDRVWRSGRLALNESRVAHISPMVEGIVREVKVRLGQDVRAGDVLVVLDCREVGQAKLDLLKNRLAAKYAKTQHAWTQATNRSASDMVDAMTDGMAMHEIEKQFKDRSIGDLRQQLMTAFSRRIQAKASYDPVLKLAEQGAVSQSTVLQRRSEFETAEAAFRALCEEVKFQTGQLARASEQKLREAETAEALSKATLMMLGYVRDEVDAMDPIAEGTKVSLYSIRAPFSGTVLEQHAVLAERVGPQVQMFEIADLSTLWLHADVSQTDLPLVRGLAGRKLRFRVSDDDNANQEADIFYTGDMVDKMTRATTLSATVSNPDRALKPGTFVEVELARDGARVVQVPETAIQRQGAQPFVFIHAGGGEFQWVDVKLGRTSGGVVEVVEGLKAGQSVVVTGGFILKSELQKDQIAGD